MDKRRWPTTIKVYLGFVAILGIGGALFAHALGGNHSRGAAFGAAMGMLLGLFVPPMVADLSGVEK